MVSEEISEGRHCVEAFSLSKTKGSYLMQLGSVRSWPSQGIFWISRTLSPLYCLSHEKLHVAQLQSLREHFAHGSASLSLSIYCFHQWLEVLFSEMLTFGLAESWDDRELSMCLGFRKLVVGVLYDSVD